MTNYNIAKKLDEAEENNKQENNDSIQVIHTGVITTIVAIKNEYMCNIRQIAVQYIRVKLELWFVGRSLNDAVIVFY